MKYNNKYRPMSLKDRAAQFAPFAALEGYDDIIRDMSEGLEEGPGLNRGGKARPCQIGQKSKNGPSRAK